MMADNERRETAVGKQAGEDLVGLIEELFGIDTDDLSSSRVRPPLLIGLAGHDMTFRI